MGKGMFIVMDFETAVLHQIKKETRNIKSKVTPIYQTSAFTFNDLDELEGYYQGNGNYLYSRTANPNTDELGSSVARLEGAPAGAASSSGLSAILAGVLAVVKSGDHIVAADDIYGGSFHLIKQELVELGIEVTITSFTDLSNVEKAIQPNTKLLYSESITNPLLRVEDIEQLVQLAKKHKLTTLIDNTFATPYHCKPYLLGVDIVVHSATKYMGGHSDVTAGVVVGSEELMDKVKAKITNLGVNLSAFEAWLTCRGLKTLAIRMKVQSENAKILAEALRTNPYVKRTYYPFEISEDGYGAIVTIELDEKLDHNQFFKGLDWIKIVPTLAGVETTVSHPVITSHRSLSEEERENLGINERVVRISVGIESITDIIEQINQAIDKSK